MRSVMLVSLGACLVAAAAAMVGDEKAPQPSKESYVKVRVEVEIRGALSCTDKTATVTARGQVFNQFNDAEELPDAAATTYALDFALTKDLRELAQALSGKALHNKSSLHI